MKSIVALIKNILKSKVKIVIVLIIFVAIIYLAWQKISTSSKGPEYQTAQAEKGTLITTVSASGQITTANNVAITIQASGAVKEVLVKNGDKVTQGQEVATLTLDQSSQQKQAQAYASYLSAKNQLDNATAKYNSLQASEFKANQDFINDAVERGLTVDDPIYIQENATWLQAEADYKNQATSVSAAQASLNSSSLALSQASSTITAPVAGTVKGLTITPGAIISLSSTSSSSTSTSQVLGSINQPGAIQAQVNLSEIDSVYVAEGQKVTMTLDAFPDKTFTGKIVSINTNGVVASNVTTYPAVISFDSGNDHIYPNMAVSASIITSVKDNVVLIPNAAVQTANGLTTVKELKNGNLTDITVELGGSNDTQTEVTSGVNEGDQVITSVTNSITRTTTGTTSIFGTRGFGGGFGGGGAARGR